MGAGRPALTFLLPLLLAFLTGAGAAHGTVLEPLTVDDLAARADVVLQGRVASVRTISHGARSLPVTLAQVEVGEVLAGDMPPRRRVMVSQPGGQAGGIELDYAGRPRFTSGQDVVLFLERRAPGQFITIGLAQGLFTVAPADGQGRRALSRDLRGASFATPPGEPPPGHLAILREKLARRPRDLAGGRP